MSSRVAELNSLVEGARVQRSGGPNGAIHVAWLQVTSQRHENLVGITKPGPTPSIFSGGVRETKAVKESLETNFTKFFRV